MSVWFAAGLAFLNVVLFTFDANLPPALRWVEAAAAATLGAWWIYGYRRGGFPIAGWAVDATLVLVVAAVSPMPSDAIALFFAGSSSDRSFRAPPTARAAHRVVRGSPGW